MAAIMSASKPHSLNEKVQDFLAQKRIAVIGVSRDSGRHPVGQPDLPPIEGHRAHRPTVL